MSRMKVAHGGHEAHVIAAVMAPLAQFLGCPENLQFRLPWASQWTISVASSALLSC